MSTNAGDHITGRPPCEPPPQHRLSNLTVLQLDAVVEIEKLAYPFPWTRGNFIDSLAAGYEAQVLLRDLRSESSGGGLGVRGIHGVLGYWVAMPGVDEMHLLNITVAPEHQGHGYARIMLDALVRLAQSRGDQQLWLEVRPSNTRARDLYLRYGFRQVGLRKGYYPATLGRREDALVMSFDVTGHAGAMV